MAPLASTDGTSSLRRKGAAPEFCAACWNICDTVNGGDTSEEPILVPEGASRTDERDTERDHGGEKQGTGDSVSKTRDRMHQHKPTTTNTRKEPSRAGPLDRQPSTRIESLNPSSFNPSSSSALSGTLPRLSTRPDTRQRGGRRRVEGEKPRHRRQARHAR